jgi:hypothetical protein
MSVIDNWHLLTYCRGLGAHGRRRGMVGALGWPQAWRGRARDADRPPSRPGRSSQDKEPA